MKFRNAFCFTLAVTAMGLMSQSCRKDATEPDTGYTGCRLTSASGADATKPCNTKYFYDAQGRLERMVVNDGFFFKDDTCHYAFNTSGRLIRMAFVRWNPDLRKHEDVRIDSFFYEGQKITDKTYEQDWKNEHQLEYITYHYSGSNGNPMKSEYFEIQNRQPRLFQTIEYKADEQNKTYTIIMKDENGQPEITDIYTDFIGKYVEATGIADFSLGNAELFRNPSFVTNPGRHTIVYHATGDTCIAKIDYTFNDQELPIKAHYIPEKGSCFREGELFYTYDCR